MTLTPVPLPADRYEADSRIEAFFGALLERLQASPGVEAVSLTTAPPLAGHQTQVPGLVFRVGRLELPRDDVHLITADDAVVSSAREKSRPCTGATPSVEIKSALTREARSRTGPPAPDTVTLAGLIVMAPSRSKTAFPRR